jgi:hypothetical protein
VGEGEGEVQLDTPRRSCPCLAAASVGGAAVVVVCNGEIRRATSRFSSS